MDSFEEKHYYQDRQRSRSRSEEERVPIKRKLRVQSTSGSSSSSGDQRNVVIQSKKPKVADYEFFERRKPYTKSVSPEPKPGQIKEEFDNVQELQVGNLINPVEKLDLEQLLDGYGKIKGRDRYFSSFIEFYEIIILLLSIQSRVHSCDHKGMNVGSQTTHGASKMTYNRFNGLRI